MSGNAAEKDKSTTLKIGFLGGGRMAQALSNGFMMAGELFFQWAIIAEI